MGVPKFFRWLSERYPKINQPINCDPNPKTREKYFNSDDSINSIFNDDNKTTSQNDRSNHIDVHGGEFIDPSIPEFDRLYIDMNGIIHGCSHNNSDQQQTLATNTESHQLQQQTPITEGEIFANISYYLDRVVSDIVKPKELIYMAIDGVAPRAKMNQQRSRRFRSGKESEIALIQRQKMENEMQNKIDLLEDDQDEEERLIEEQLSLYDDEFDRETRIEENRDLLNGSVTFEMEGNDIVTTSTGGFAGTIKTGQLKKKHEKLVKDVKSAQAEVTSQYANLLSNGINKNSEGTDKYEENDKKDDEKPFHHNSITPGTPFLDRCSAYIQNYIRHKLLSGDPAWKGLKIIFSGPNVPGEGEHKIMDFIRKEQQLEENSSSKQRKRHCLMGQDGDLIMLGLATHELNFCLLREKVVFGQQNKLPPIANNNTSMSSTQTSIRQYTDNPHFQLLHLNILRDYLAYEFETSDIVPESPFNLERTIDDFVFLTFFVGNDFLPHMPALDIGDGAFDLLFQKYKKHRANWIREGKMKKRSKKSNKSSDYPYFTKSGEIVNGDRLEMFLMDVGRHEDPYYDWKKRSEDKTYENIRKNDKKYGRKFTVPSKEERELVESENRQKYKSMLENIAQKAGNESSHSNSIMNGENEPVLTSKSLPNVKFIPEYEDEEDEEGLFSQFTKLISDSLSPTSRKKQSHSDAGQYLFDDSDMTDLKGRYYYDKFNFTPLDNEKHQALRKAYIEGLVWNLKYYYQGCVSWEWYYPYHYGPMLSDLKNISSMLGGIKFKEGAPFRPFEQLLACMPPNSAHVLPQPYQFLMTDKDNSPIVEYYPEDFVVDMNGKHNPWEAVVLLPFIDANKLQNTVEELVDMDSLTDEEKRRNQFSDSWIMYMEEEGLREDVMSMVSSAGVKHDVPSYLNQSNEGDAAVVNHLLPGFSTLRTVPITALERKPLKLNIFGTLSRYKTSVLNMDALSYSILPPAFMLGKNFIGTTIFFQYPYFREGFVTSVSDSKGYMRGNSNYEQWDNNADVAEWKNRAERLYREYEAGDGTVGSGGWHIPSKKNSSSKEEQEEIIITVRPLKGLERLESGEMIKIYEKEEIYVPFIAALWNPHQTDQRLIGIRAKLENDPYSLGIQNHLDDKTQSKINDSGGFHGKEASHNRLVFGGPLPSLDVQNGKPTTSLPPLSSKRFSKSFSTASLPESLSKHHLGRINSYMGSSKKVQSTSCPTYCRRKANLNVGSCFNGSSVKLSRHRVLRRGIGSATTIALLASSLFSYGGKSSFPFTDAKLTPKSSFSRSSLHSFQSSQVKNHLDQTLCHLRCGNIIPDDFIGEKEADGNFVGNRSSPPPLEFAHGTTTLSFIFQGGIVAAVDSRASLGNFVGSKTTQKVLPISKHILGTMAGGAADCTFWIRKLQSYASLHSLTTQHSISIARASRLLSDFLYQNRQLDLSVGTMIMGFDARGASIYYVDNTGLRIGGELFAVGSGSTFALGILDTVSREDRWEMNEEEAIELGIRAIRHATFRDAFSGGYIGVYLITKKHGWRKVFSEDLASVSGHVSTNSKYDEG